MTTDEYVPSDEDVYGVWTNYQCFGADDGYGPRGVERAAAEMDRFLARVRRDAKAEALREAVENVDVGSLADAWTHGAVTRLSVTNAVAEVLMSLRNRATEYETGDSDERTVPEVRPIR